MSTLRHFRRAVGHSVRLRADGEELTGVVTAADADSADGEGDGDGLVSIEVDGVERRIALRDISEAQMVVTGL